MYAVLIMKIYTNDAGAKLVKSMYAYEDENIQLKAQLAEAQSYKADAERYRNLKEIICPMEGLSITFEYRKGDKKIANRKVFTLSEMEHDYAFSNRIEWNCAWLYGKIKRELEAIDQAMKEVFTS